MANTRVVRETKVAEVHGADKPDVVHEPSVAFAWFMVVEISFPTAPSHSTDADGANVTVHLFLRDTFPLIARLTETNGVEDTFYVGRPCPA